MCLFRKEMLKYACKRMSKLDFKGHTVTAMKTTELSVAFCQGSWCGSWVMLITRWRGNLRCLARSCNVGVFLMQLQENGWKLSTCHAWKIEKNLFDILVFSRFSCQPTYLQTGSSLHLSPLVFFTICIREQFSNKTLQFQLSAIIYGIKVLSGFWISQTVMHSRIGYDTSLISPMLEAELATFQFGGWCWFGVISWVALHQMTARDHASMMSGHRLVYSFRIQTAIAWVARSDLWPKAFQSCQPGNLQNHPFFQLTSTIFPPLRVMLGGFVSMCDRVSLVDRFYLIGQLQNPSNPSFFDPIRVCKIKVDMATILITLAMRNCMHDLQLTMSLLYVQLFTFVGVSECFWFLDPFLAHCVLLTLFFRKECVCEAWILFVAEASLRWVLQRLAEAVFQRGAVTPINFFPGTPDKESLFKSYTAWSRAWHLVATTCWLLVRYLWKVFLWSFHVFSVLLKTFLCCAADRASPCFPLAPSPRWCISQATVTSA